MPNRAAAMVAGALLAIAGASALAACTGVLPPAMDPSPHTPEHPAASPVALPATDTAVPASTAIEASPSPVPIGARLAFVQDVVPVVRQHCAACHRAGGMGAGAVSMFDASGVPQGATLKARMGDMLAAVRAGRMPMGKPDSVPEAQLAVLAAWQAAGGPLEGTFTVGASTPGSVASASPTAAPSASPTTAATASPAAGGVYLRSHVAPILAQHCQSCHVTGGIAPFAMFDVAGTPLTDTVKAQIGSMVAAIEAGRMPMGKPHSVPADQVAVLKAWQSAGMPLDPGPTPSPAAATPEPTAPTSATVSFQDHVVPILRNRCSACHTVGGRGAYEVAMFNRAGQVQYWEIEDEIDDMIEEVEKGEMPQGAPPGTVKDWELDTLRAWYRAGSPNN